MKATMEDQGKEEGCHEPEPEPEPSPTISTTKVEYEPHQPSTQATPSSSSDEEIKKWGTHIMGQPAAPTFHPDNQKAALWSGNDCEKQQKMYELPYVIYSPAQKPTNNPLEPAINMFNTWSKKADTIARNIWHNLKTGPSVSEAAWGKINLTAKAITEGGFESLFKQIFATDANEKLLKAFACYLSTTTGPVAGTLYHSNARLAFCSDRPLCFTAPSGQETWSYYKVMIPLTSIGTVNPVVMKENPPENYTHVVTVDDHDFWFMGFVNFNKASVHLVNSLKDFKATKQ